MLCSFSINLVELMARKRKKRQVFRSRVSKVKSMKYASSNCVNYIITVEILQAKLAQPGDPF